MRAIIQRSLEASVMVAEECVGRIEHGLVVLIGIEHTDNIEDAEWLAAKIVQLRIFSDSHGQMNISIQETKGDILAISQFTLHAKTKKGNRPSFINAARPEFAKPLFDKFIEIVSQKLEKTVETGVFGADMQVLLINDGPVTIYIDTKNKE